MQGSNTSILVCGWAIAAVLLVLVFIRLIIAIRPRRRLFLVFSPLLVYTIGIFCVAFVFTVSQELAGLFDSTGSTLLIDSFLQTIKLFALDREITLTTADVASLGAVASQAYLMFNALLFLLAPIGTLSAIFSLVGQFFSAPRLRARSMNRDTFVFSKLSRGSLALAQSICEHYASASAITPAQNRTRRCLIAFSDTDDCEKSLIAQAKSSSMLCLHLSSAGALKVAYPGSTRKVFIISSDDETANINEGIALVREMIESRRFPSTTRTAVYIFSSSPAAESLIDAAMSDEASIEAEDAAGNDMSSKLIVRRVDLSRTVVDTILTEHPLFLVEQDAGDKPTDDRTAQDVSVLYALERRRIVIVGAGSTGYGFLEGALWCGQMDGVGLDIDVIDGSDAVEPRFRLDAPEVMALPSEYHVRFLTMDVASDSYLDYLEANRKSITYVLVALGDDLLDTRTAMRTRELLEQDRFMENRPQATIVTIVLDTQLSSTLADMRKGNRSYNIHTVGDLSTLYSFDNFFNPWLETYARNVNRAYWGCLDTPDPDPRMVASADRAFDVSEYSRRSSRASAIHLKYNLFVYCRNMLLGRHDIPRDAAVIDLLSDVCWESHLHEIDLRILDSYTAYVDGTSALRATAAKDAPHEGPSDHEGPSERQGSSDHEWLLRMEHDRWSAYMRTQGYECADEAEVKSFFPRTGKHQDVLAKKHACLVPFDALSDVDRFVDECRLSRDPSYSGHADFRTPDDVIVRNLQKICTIV